MHSEYLTMTLKNINEFNIIYNWLIKKKYSFDLFFLINFDKKINLYIRKTDDKNKTLKEIHHFYYMNINNLCSFKKISKHSVFLNGLNIFLKNQSCHKKYNSDLPIQENFIIDLIDN